MECDITACESSEWTFSDQVFDLQLVHLQGSKRMEIFQEHILGRSLGVTED